MIRRFLPLLLLFSCSVRQPPGKEELVCIQIKDQNGLSETVSVKERIQKYETVDFLKPQPYLQVFRTFGKDEQGKSHSIITTYHPNGQIAEYLETIDTTALGTYKEWHANGALKIQATIIGGPADINSSAKKDWVFDGLSEAWDESGNLSAKIYYEKGYLQEKSEYFYKNGPIKKTIPFLNGDIHGEVCEYYENGNLQSKTFYESGYKQDLSLGYWENETPSFFEEYDKDKLKTGVYYTPSGSVISEVQGGSGKKAFFEKETLTQLQEYQRGEQMGKVECFSPNKVLKSHYNIQEGKRQGEEIEFYHPHELYGQIKSDQKLPQPKLLVHWDSDRIHGTVKTWYENSLLESQKEYYANKKNGMSCAWYADGSLMFIEEYENDELLKGTYYKIKQNHPISKVVDGNGHATIYEGKTGGFLRKVHYQNGYPQE